MIFVSSYTPVHLGNMIDEEIQSTSDPEVKNTLLEAKEKLIRFFSHLTVLFLKKDQKNHPVLIMDKYYLDITKHQCLWEKCTLNEKFILMDLAMDSLANPKNKIDIGNLIAKGLLEVDGRLCFADKGFEHYIRTLEEFR